VVPGEKFVLKTASTEHFHAKSVISKIIFSIIITLVSDYIPTRRIYRSDNLFFIPRTPLQLHRVQNKYKINFNCKLCNVTVTNLHIIDFL
jgi:hypothetical protein